MLRRTAIKSLLMAFGAWLLLALIYVLPWTQTQVRDLNNLSLVWHFKLRGEREPSPEIRVLGIDQGSITVLRETGGDAYPFPRDLHALVLRRLADAGAKLVVVDILFTAEGSWSDSEDGALRDALLYCQERGVPVILACAIDYGRVQGQQLESLILPAEVVLEAQPLLGLSNTEEKLSYRLFEPLQDHIETGGAAGEGQSYYSLAAEAFHRSFSDPSPLTNERLFKEGLRRVSAGRDSFIVDYSRPFGPGNLLNFNQLLPELPLSEDDERYGAWLEAKELRDLRADGELSFAQQRRLEELQRLSPEQLKALNEKLANTVVFVGSRNAADGDTFNTPFGRMYGVDTIAQAYDTLARGVRIRSISGYWLLLLLAGLALLGWAIAQSRPLRRAALFGLAAVGAVLAGNIALFDIWNVELSLPFTVLGFAVPFACCAVYGGVGEEYARRRLRETFSRYVSQELADQVVANPSLGLIGGGVKREAAVLFNDIRSYSTLSEHMEPGQVVELLNTYFGEAAETVRRHGGSVDKYLGDGMMASFGALVPRARPAADALSAGLEIVQVLHERVSPRLRELGLPQFKVGIGLHYGFGVAANIGSASRLDFTFIGDTTNLASRVETATKDYGWALLCTRELLEAALEREPSQGGSAEPGGQALAWERVGEQLVKGRETPVELYRVYVPGREEEFRL
ncbi:adenylate/guanylate cyclase domain-containing protein [bacterium]|nr:adenylate/guanylate cyclase domain-containing protein [bacterium]